MQNGRFCFIFYLYGKESLVSEAGSCKCRLYFKKRIKIHLLSSTKNKFSLQSLEQTCKLIRERQPACHSFVTYKSLLSTCINSRVSNYESHIPQVPETIGRDTLMIMSEST